MPRPELEAIRLIVSPHAVPGKATRINPLGSVPTYAVTAADHERLTKQLGALAARPQGLGVGALRDLMESGDLDLAPTLAADGQGPGDAPALGGKKASRRGV